MIRDPSQYVICVFVWMLYVDYKYGMKLVSVANNKTLLMLNARNEQDRDRFVADLKEAVLEVICCYLHLKLLNRSESTWHSWLVDKGQDNSYCKSPIIYKSKVQLWWNSTTISKSNWLLWRKYCEDSNNPNTEP